MMVYNSFKLLCDMHMMFNLLLCDILSNFCNKRHYPMIEYFLPRIHKSH